MYMRRVYGMKVTRITRGWFCRPAPGILGQGGLETGHLKFGRSQQRPYEPIPKNPTPPDPREWYDVTAWLREKGALNVHGPFRRLSRDEINNLAYLYT